MRSEWLMLVLCPFVGLAQQPLLEATLYSGTNPVGCIRQVCIDEAGAAALLTRYTNNLTGIGKGYELTARYHTCNHDVGRVCEAKLIAGKSLDGAWAMSGTNLCAVVEMIPQKTDNKAVHDNPPLFKIPCTVITGPTIITKIITEEFPGKQVTTNVSATAISDLTPKEVPK